MTRAPGRPAARSKPWLLLALAALTLLAFVPRARGLETGLPCSLEQDAKLHFQLELARTEEPDETLIREASWYPPLLGRVAGIVPVDDEVPTGATLEEHLAAAGALPRRIRLTVMLLSLLAIPVTWALARCILRPYPALFAAALVATSLLGTSFASQARPHAAAAALDMLAVLCCVGIVLRGSGWMHLAAGLSCAAAMSALQSGTSTLVALAAALLWRAVSTRRWLDPRVLLALAPIVVAGLAFYSGSSSDSGPDMELDPSGRALVVSGHLIWLHEFRGRGFSKIAHTMVTYEPVLLVLSLFALPLLFLGPRSDARRGVRSGPVFVMAAYALAYLLVTGLYSNTHERFVLPLVPLFAVLAAAGAQRLAGRIEARGSGAPRAAWFALAALTLALPGYACWRLGEVRARPTTRELAASWLREHLPNPGRPVLLSPGLDLPLARPPEGLLLPFRDPAREPTHLPWITYQRRAPAPILQDEAYPLGWIPVGDPRTLAQALDAPLESIASWPADVVVMEVFAEGRVLPAVNVLSETLRAHARLLARISPDGRDGYSEHPMGFQDETSVRPTPFLPRLLQAERYGPVLEIYELPGAAGGPAAGR